MVSVIIPTYNSEKYIGKCLDSIILQDYKDIEIIVVDDCSTDSTRKIVDAYFKKDSRIIPIFLKKNGGVSCARNKGLERYTGDYVMFVDSDDYLTPNAISQMVLASERYDSDYVDCYHFTHQLKNGKETDYTECHIPKKALVLGDLNNNPNIINISAYVTGKLISSDLIDQVKFDETLKCYEDILFESELKSRLKNYVLLNDSIYEYTRDNESITSNSGLKYMCFLDSAKEVKKVYSNFSKEIQDISAAKMISTMYYIMINKIIKNDLSTTDNIKNTYNLMCSIKKLYPDYNDNKYLNIFFKHQLNCMTLKSIRRDINIFKHINFDKIYLFFISVFNRYKRRQFD